MNVAMLSALRHPGFRLYWFGFLASIIGFQIQIVGIGYFVFDRTGSELNLGLVSGAQAAAGILFAVLGGVIADRVERRQLLMLMQAGALACTLTLSTLVAVDVIRVWQVAAIAFVFGSFQAFDQPTRAAILPQLIDRKDLPNAIALTSAVWQASAIIGPMIMGLVTAFAGFAAMFYLSSAGFAVFILVLAVLKVKPPVVAPDQIPQSKRTIGADLVAGMSYIRGNRLFRALISLAFLNAIFGLSFIVLLPAFAIEQLDVGSGGFAALYIAMGVGSLVGTLAIAALGDFPNKGRMVVGGAVAFGGLLIVFSVSTWLPVSMVLLLAIGLVRALYMTSAQTMIQLRLDDRYRGRVMAVYGLQWSLMPLGGLIGGLTAEFFGAPVAVGFGGVAVVMFSLLIGLRQLELREGREPSASEAVPAG